MEFSHYDMVPGNVQQQSWPRPRWRPTRTSSLPVAEPSFPRRAWERSPDALRPARDERGKREPCDVRSHAERGNEGAATLEES